LLMVANRAAEITKHVTTLTLFPSAIRSRIKVCANRKEQTPDSSTATKANIRTASNFNDSVISSVIVELLYMVCMETNGNNIANRIHKPDITESAHAIQLALYKY